jgi:hypothetical protein
MGDVGHILIGDANPQENICFLEGLNLGDFSFWAAIG